MSNQVSNDEASASIQDDKVDASVISFHDLIAAPRVILAMLASKENFNALVGLAESLGLKLDELQILLLKNMITANMQ
ncbi:unnamed protein product [Peronospora farinosa]|uniref:Uncharacterized protein n=1 Tax=Peronospora farinosa TaxID=134698 RepID=A0AAV0THM0_9STRA|nr:unnamed protein product [Peronospora farinosa]